jgi:hypothetical protein
MSTRDQLERKFAFRFVKVFFIFFVAIVAVITLFIWYNSREQVFEASQAYFLCNNQGNTQFQLTNSEKIILSNIKQPFFHQYSDEQMRINKVCYKQYSGGKEPELASESDISLFREFEKGIDGRVYTIQGIRIFYDWGWEYLLYSIIVEYIIFQFLKYLGLYIAGGKEALKH